MGIEKEVGKLTVKLLENALESMKKAIEEEKRRAELAKQRAMQPQVNTVLKYQDTELNDIKNKTDEINERIEEAHKEPKDNIGKTYDEIIRDENKEKIDYAKEKLEKTFPDIKKEDREKFNKFFNSMSDPNMKPEKMAYCNGIMETFNKNLQKEAISKEPQLDQVKDMANRCVKVKGLYEKDPDVQKDVNKIAQNGKDTMEHINKHAKKRPEFKKKLDEKHINTNEKLPSIEKLAEKYKEKDKGEKERER